MSQCMLSTIDNPYNPFTNWEEWFAFDELKGYHSCSYLARIAKTSNDLTDSEYEEAVEQAIDEIIRINPLNIYIKVNETNETKV